MLTCKGCGAEHSVEALVRHEHDRLLVVHCPDCGCVLGRYRRHGDQTPATADGN